MKSLLSRRVRGGFTLIELVMATLIMGIVMGALGSVFVLTARALPDGQPATQTQDAAAALIQRLSAELQCATSVTSATATSIEFITPDRTGDGVADTIKYDWSGVTGGSVTRALNGAAPGIVLDNVKRFKLAYQLQSEAVSAAAPSAEVQLASYDNTASTGAQITPTLWRGAMVLPTLASGATSYTITRIVLNMRTGSGTNNTTTVDIRAIDSSGTPTGSALATATIPHSAVTSTASWLTATFATPPTIAATSGFSFVVSSATGGSAARMTTVAGDTAAPAALGLATINAGSSWTKGGKDLVNFQVYGCVYTSSASASTRRFLTRVRYEVQANTSGSPLLSGGISLANQPEVP